MATTPGEPDEETRAREEIIVDQVAKEQLLNMLPRQMKKWLAQQDLKTSREIVQKLTEHRLIQKESPAVHSTMRRPSHETTRQQESTSTNELRASKSSTREQRPFTTSTTSLSTRRDSIKEKTCYKCGKKGHMMGDC